MVIKKMIEKSIANEYDRSMALEIWKWIKGGLAAAVLSVGAWQSFYTVPANSIAVVQRFGAYSREENSGLRFKIPFGIERATKIPVQQIQTQEFGFRSISGGFIGSNEISKLGSGDLEEMIERSGKVPQGDLGNQMREILKSEYLMLTGDLNMADCEWIVQYNIKSAKDYLFNVKDPVNTLRDSSLSVMKQLTGNRSVDEVITVGREEYALQSKVELQKLLDECGTGINVVALKIQSSNAPAAVRSSFNAVSKALQEKESMINNAMKDYNTEVPRAAGEAQKEIEDAKGYYAKRVNEAKGDVLKFDQVYKAYAQAPLITRARMYYEAIDKFLPQAAEVRVVEQKGAEGGILLKYDLERGGK